MDYAKKLLDVSNASASVYGRNGPSAAPHNHSSTLIAINERPTSALPTKQPVGSAQVYGSQKLFRPQTASVQSSSRILI